VLHVDRFGNLCSNIDAQMLTRPVNTVEVGNILIKGMSRFFGQVSRGEPLALINSFGLLEIAINCGDAAEILGIKIGDQVSVRWG
jgi:S-adenosyl-L-methionine hydrolase (adenosine-forming)